MFLNCFFLLPCDNCLCPSRRFATSYPQSSFPLTSGLGTNDPCLVLFGSTNTTQIWLNCTCLASRKTVGSIKSVLFYFSSFPWCFETTQNRVWALWRPLRTERVEYLYNDAPASLQSSGSYEPVLAPRLHFFFLA